MVLVFGVLGTAIASLALYLNNPSELRGTLLITAATLLSFVLAMWLAGFAEGYTLAFLYQDGVPRAQRYLPATMAVTTSMWAVGSLLTVLAIIGRVRGLAIEWPLRIFIGVNFLVIPTRVLMTRAEIMRSRR